MGPYLSYDHWGDPGGKKTRIVRRVYRNPNTVRRPFYQTHLGRIPPELREKIFMELLADPPSYAGHSTIYPGPTTSPTAPKRFVHIKRSWYQVVRTCRQIYLESHPIFFAAKAYHFENTQDLARFLDPANLRILRCDTITTLCLKDLMKEHHVFTTEQIDDILSRSNDQGNSDRRRYYETITFKSFDYNACRKVKQLKNLKTVGFCMKVGEELLYINLLFFLSDMRRGIVDFVDAFRWLIRPQNPEDVWSIQYACFSNGDYATGKENEAVTYDRLSIEQDVTDINSRVPGLREGDERYVEAQIQRHVMGESLEELAPRDEGAMDFDSTSAHSEMSGSVYDSDDARFEEMSGDEFEDSTQSETSEFDRLLPEIEEASPDESEDDMHSQTSGSDQLPPGTESGSNVIDQSSLLGLHNEDGRTTQAATSTDREENQDLLQNRGEDVSSTQPIAHFHHHPTQGPPFTQITHNFPAATINNRNPTLEIHHEDDPVQTPTSNRDHAAQFPTPQSRDVHSTPEIAEEPTPKPAVKPRTRLRSIHRSRTSRLALLPISDNPNPYTEEEEEEEMGSYEHQSQSQSSNIPDRETPKQDSLLKIDNKNKVVSPSASEEIQDNEEQLKAQAPAPNIIMIKNTDVVTSSQSQRLVEILVTWVENPVLFLLFVLLVGIPEMLSKYQEV
ncbi:MAG: hypothetical protein Q9161_004189 [Pseudevernia consocians]